MGKKHGTPHKKGKNHEKEFIGHYEQAPSYMKDNDHITHGYRINFNTPKKIIRSLFMVHNESVNIWTHFLPALFIVGILSYFVLYVGPANIVQELHAGKQSLSKGIESYSEALNQMSVTIKMKEISELTERELKEISSQTFDRFNHFSESIDEWKVSIENKFENIQNSMKKTVQKQIHQLEGLKRDFEKYFVPYIVGSFKEKIEALDPEKIRKLESRIRLLKEKVDSDTFKYIELPYSNSGNPHEVSRWPVLVFMASALICLMCSTLFHLFYPMSGKAYVVFSRLDYAGVNILISGSAVPALYYGMYCNFEIVIFYLTFIFLIGFSLFVFTLFEFLHRPENFTLKSLAYGGFGVSLIIPLSHMMINELVYGNYGDPFTFKISFVKFVLVGASYLGGLYVYTVRCPERYHPGKFNVCGHSHQIWHLFVVLGIIFTYMGTIQVFETRKVSVCPSIPFAI